MDERVWFARRDLFLIGGLILAAAVLFCIFALLPRGGQVVIERNGEEILSVPLPQTDETEEIGINGEDGIRLIVEIGRGYAAVTHADCPDRTCVKTGKIRRAGEAALCLPAKVSVKISGSADADAVTY